MTEQTFPSGGTAVAEPPLPALPMDGGDAPDDGSRRKLLIVAAALGVLVLAIAAFFLLKGGGSNPAAAPSSASLPPASTPAQTQQHAKAHKPLTLPKQYKGHVGRDPFKPLYTAPSAAPSTGGATTTGSGATDSSTAGTGDSTAGSTSGTTTPTAPVYRPIWIQLKRVSGQQVVFAIGYSNRHSLRVDRFTVTAPKGATGTIFARSFSLLNVSGSEVTVKYGDGTPFTLSPAQPSMSVN